MIRGLQPIQGGCIFEIGGGAEGELAADPPADSVYQPEEMVAGNGHQGYGSQSHQE